MGCENDVKIMEHGEGLILKSSGKKKRQNHHFCGRNVQRNKVIKRFKFTWYISSPRADNCSSVLAAVNNALKVYARKRRMSTVKSTKLFFYCFVSVKRNQMNDHCSESFSLG